MLRRVIYAAGLGLIILLMGAASAPPAVTVYAESPQHIWNRLHQRFFVRTAWDGTTYGADELDPLLWLETKYLLSGPSHQQALAELNQFLSSHAEHQIADPLKRAMFQRDMWAVFDWLESAENGSPESRAALQKRLATIISRVALSRQQILSLSDNYAQAVASKTFSQQYDSAKSDVAFLPADLLDANGPWVCLGRIGGLTAPSHSDFTSGRSVFLVFLRLPQGRDAALAYLEQLRNFPDPLVPNHKEFYELLRNVGDGASLVPNPRLPQFPAGTEVALVRRMILIDDKGQPEVSPITESVQIRVYRDVPSRPTWKQGSFRDFQDVDEFRLSRQRLFAGESGGLRPLAPNAQGFPQFMSHGMDEFETEPDTHEHRTAPVRMHLLETCGECHDAPGIHSLISYVRGPFLLSDPPAPMDLRESTPLQEEQGAVEQLRLRAQWKNLQEMTFGR